METQTQESTEEEDEGYNFWQELNLLTSGMAETNTTEIAALEKAIYAQQQLLQKLNNELDVERESASTAASEALSMILRLQDEKASLKMEASQYKRMAEEKMCHAEEALAIFEDLIYQREMEIASLEYQVQAYRYRLLSMGFNDLGVYEFKFPENILTPRNDSLFREKGLGNRKIRRFSSVPPLLIKERKRIGEEKENDDPEKKVSDLNSYWDQKKKLDERMKEFSDSGRNKSTVLKGVSWSPSLFLQLSNGPSTEAHEKESVSVSASASASASSSGIHDGNALESLKKEIRRLNLELGDETVSSSYEKKYGKPRCGISSSEYQQLSQRIERLERGRDREIVAEGEEEMKLLKEICEQLKSIQSEMKSLKAKKSKFPIEPSLDCLQEAMLYFWM